MIYDFGFTIYEGLAVARASRPRAPSPLTLNQTLNLNLNPFSPSALGKEIKSKIKIMIKSRATHEHTGETPVPLLKSI